MSEVFLCVVTGYDIWRRLGRLGSVTTVKSWCLMLVVMMETDGSNIQWDSGCASATSFYEFTWGSLELLSERKSNI